ncbi:MAG: capsule biosynthesis GfcC D2 domain-containing protein [Marinomonas sp.]
MIVFIRHLSFVLCVWMGHAGGLSAESRSEHPETTSITLTEQNIVLNYDQAVRFSQVLGDAYSYTNNKIYPLGISLISPHKKSLADQKKALVLDALKELNTAEANNLIAQLSDLNFVYREKIETDIEKVRLLSRSNPMLRGQYQLFLSTRPDHIRIFSGDYEESFTQPLKANYDLKDYVSELPNFSNIHSQETGKKKPKYHSAWIIQPNQDVYLANDIQWARTVYFLSPGAFIFIELADLPNKHSDLNADIAHLLTYYMEP